MLLSYLSVLNVIFVQSFPLVSNTIKSDNIIDSLDENARSSNVNPQSQNIDDQSFFIPDAIKPQSISPIIALEGNPAIPPAGEINPTYTPV